MPLLILMGGEAVVVIMGVRITLWLIRSWLASRADGPMPPPDGGGTPLRVPSLRPRSPFRAKDRSADLRRAA
jgi:hypothetical protein